MRAVRWVLLLLYLLLVGGLSAMALSSDEALVWIPVGVALLAWAVFLLGAGHRDLFRPIRRPRIFLPVVSASFMLTVLMASLAAALGELFFVESSGEGAWSLIGFWGSLLATWIFWGIILYAYTRDLPRYDAIFQLAQFLFAGSIAELLATVPSHLIVSRRSYCLAGLSTGIGLMAGLLVMLWSFGPAIFLLFLHEIRRSQEREMLRRQENRNRAIELRSDDSAPRQAAASQPSLADSAGDAQIDPSPATSAPQAGLGLFQFRLRTLLVAITLVAVICGVLRSFWGDWPVVIVFAWGVMLLVVPILLRRHWIMQAAVFVALAGVVCAFWSEPGLLLIVVVPTGLLGIVLLKLIGWQGNTHHRRLTRQTRKAVSEDGS
jgi:hypothetical protein